MNYSRVSKAMYTAKPIRSNCKAANTIDTSSTLLSVFDSIPKGAKVWRVELSQVIPSQLKQVNSGKVKTSRGKSKQDKASRVHMHKHQCT